MSILLGSKLEKEITECLFTSFFCIFYKILKRRFAFEKVSEAERYSFDRPCVAGMGRHGGVDSCLNNTRFSKTPTRPGTPFPVPVRTEKRILAHAGPEERKDPL